MVSTALLTDHYELTMLQATLADGTAERRSVFEVFGRRFHGGRRFGVVAGTGRVLDALADFRFDPAEIEFLRSARVVDEATCDWLADYRFTGDIWGYPEGELWFPGSPVLRIDSTFGEGVILETLILSILNHDSAIASAAARMTLAAGDRPCIEMGTRRTHEEAAVASARAAYICGFAATSNLEAGRRYAIPTAGTAAHAFTLVHDTERDAFASQVASLGAETTLLVDTYDTPQGVATAIEVGGATLGGVRLDSGDLGDVARTTRAQLDAAGNTDTKITVTSDLDEYAIAALAAAPVDGYGVGTSLVTGSGSPTSGFVYKLVARESSDGTMLGVAKKSKDKASVGGRKTALRRLNHKGVAEAEVIGIDITPRDDGDDRELMVPLVEQGKRVHDATLHDARERLQASLGELPAAARRLSKGDPAIPTIFEEG
ncbi:nicotinate phosphoribosyltransferase [Aeromicrobium duanguangcaii]|uniref:Nicotinate phosphoribosyltransferase n=1 Tax=Aeromicrobium duanguangcaii TaxID=2968086 RepID=A0ABY5KC98_9ACTN|nr:nicotinate phosphoribosyltransferase [Aeromicrobium duanguangcaii]MCD9154682.1 nicotinate phosphoribosyltransferase [Aeromicrobium duanguangcaii]UUI67904.1 nicotinate phosphoribosyltransferase [Aeromicrobium duanguangcaii]